MRTHTRLSSRLKPVASSTVHLPYTISARAAGQMASGISHPSRTGVSSSFAKPTEPANFTVPSASASQYIPATGRLPFSKSVGLVFLNSTSAMVIAEYYQCGGINWKGEGTCVKGMVCKCWNFLLLAVCGWGEVLMFLRRKEDGERWADVVLIEK